MLFYSRLSPIHHRNLAPICILFSFPPSPLLYVSLSLSVSLCASLYTCQWKPEVDTGYPLQLLSTFFFFETESLTEVGFTDLASELSGKQILEQTPCLRLLSTEITTVCFCAWLFPWMLGLFTQINTLAHRALDQLSSLLSPYIHFTDREIQQQRESEASCSRHKAIRCWLCTWLQIFIWLTLKPVQKM